MIRVTIHDEATRQIAVMALWQVVANLCDLDHVGMHDAAYDASYAWNDPAETAGAIEETFGQVDAVREAIRQTEATPIGGNLREPNLVRQGLEWVLAGISENGERLLASSESERARIMGLYDAGLALSDQLKVEAVA